jgi:DNA-binding protein H-NS
MSDTELLKKLAGSKSAVNRAAKPLDITDLKNLVKNLTATLQAVEKREAARDEKKKALALKKLRAMMKESGLSPQDVAKLAGAEPNAKIKRKSATKKKSAAKVPPKYQINVDGKVHQWTGRGRTPVVFREHVNNGGSLEDCLIK